VEEIGPGIYVETGFRRVTVGAVLTDEGWVLIDTPPYPEDANRWREQLAQESPRPVLFVINTDHHRDRILGNCWFEAHVVAHQHTSRAVRSLPHSFLDDAIEALSSSEDARPSFSEVKLVPPGISFSDRLHIKRGGRVITPIGMPGPTPGSAWVHFPEHRIVFVGDSVVVGTHPYMAQAATKAWLESLTALRRARFAADVVVPGRGAVTDKGATVPVSDYVRLARRRVYSLYRAGRPRADTSSLIEEFMPLFPVDGPCEEIQRRIKSGLDRIYEEYKAGEAARDQKQ
jgi:glyoxylase-like metal-dependent hydrolase (beta-lactamase superfamily II)